jgi:hypothetical protein
MTAPASTVRTTRSVARSRHESSRFPCSQAAHNDFQDVQSWRSIIFNLALDIYAKPENSGPDLWVVITKSGPFCDLFEDAEVSLASSRTTFTSSLLPSVTACRYCADEAKLRNRRSCIRVIGTSVRAPHAIAIPERWIGAVRRECLGDLLITGARHLVAPQVMPRRPPPLGHAGARHLWMTAPAPVSSTPGRAPQAGGSGRAGVSPRSFLRSRRVWGRAGASCGRS